MAARRLRHKGLLVLVAVLASSSAGAGDIDTHLAASHYLARRAGLDERDAALIARADWSLDMNRSTTALPTVDPGVHEIWNSDQLSYTNRASFLDWRDRGRTYHSFGASPEEVRKNLQTLREAIPATPPQGNTESDRDREARLRAVGQYLHAMQDVFFHQSQGKTLDPGLGHLLTSVHFDEFVLHPDAVKVAKDRFDLHEADKVPLHFDAALLAYDETAKVFDAIKRGEPVPDIDWDRAYEKRAQIPASFAKSFDPELVKLASAIGKSYDSFTEKHRLDQQVLDASLRTLWVTQGHSEGFEPFVELGSGDRALINYDTNPQFLAVHIPERKDEPGGISFSTAAAESLPLQMNIDGILVDDGRLVLTGGSAAELQQFDAAQLLTAFRLACSRGDPSFSLDPVDGSKWKSEGTAAAESVQSEQQDTLTNAPALEPGDSSPIGAIGFQHQAYMRDSPALRSKLVFSPEWLRGTEFGKVMYDADVLLKVLATGMPIDEGGGLGRAPRLSDYHSADERAVVNQVFAGLNGNAKAAPMEGYRLWFQLSEASTPDPFAYMAPPDLQLHFDSLLTPPALTGAERARELLQERLREAGLIDVPGSETVRANPNGSRVSVSGKAMDLGAVWPQLYVRKHDLASGEDLSGESLELGAVAADVNSRTAQWAAEYPELQSLVNALRVYVAAVKVSSEHREICHDLARLPLLPSEKLHAPLPTSRPAMLTVAAVSFRTANGTAAAGDSTTGEATTAEATDMQSPETQSTDTASQGTLGYAIAYSLNGGISLGVKDAPNAIAYVKTNTPTTDVLLAAPAGLSGTGDARTISFQMDLADASASLQSFVPVTEADVLGGGTQSDSFSWDLRARPWIARLLARPLSGTVLMMQLVGLLLFAVVGFFKLFHRGPLFGRRRRRA
jgi:hypothetical protein